MMSRRKGLLAALVFGGACALGAAGTARAITGGEQSSPGQQGQGQQGQGHQIAPEADVVLRDMSDFLSRQNAFSVQTEHSLDIVTTAGQKVQFNASSEVSVQRPNHLRVDRRGPLADLSLYYDGRELTLFGKKTKLYAKASAPSTLDATIDFAREKLDIEAPGADLLFSNPYTALTDNVVTGTYEKIEEIHGVECHQLAFRSAEVDWQIWIALGSKPLPLKFAIVSRNQTAQPQLEVELHDWDLTPTFSANTFDFVAPTDAKQIDFLELPRRRGGGGN